jgi:hypothetical protein
VTGAGVTVLEMSARAELRAVLMYMLKKDCANYWSALL